MFEAQLSRQYASEGGRLGHQSNAGRARPMLLEEEVHAAVEQIGDEEVARVVAVGRHHIASREALLQGPEQPMFARSLALVRAPCHIEHRPVASEITPTSRAIGKLAPRSCWPC